MGGGYQDIDARDQLARDSSNWMQYKLTRDRQGFADDLEMRVNTRWSQFKNKEEMSDYLSEKRTESMEEREAVRAMVRSKINKDSMSKEERIEKLRQVTEEMLTHKSDYSQSARVLAMQAYKEAEEEAKSSKQRRKVTVVESKSQ